MSTATHQVTSTDIYSGALCGNLVTLGTEAECVEYLAFLAEHYGVEMATGGHVLRHGAMTYLISRR